VVSLDFELWWGVRDAVTMAAYEANLRGTRPAVDALLNLFAAHGIRATWAVVGILMADGREEALGAAPSERPNYAESCLDPYAELERSGPSEQDDPLRFAPSLVAAIGATEGQELATHSFSHFYALEPERTREAFAADLDAALALALRRGVTITSVVFPRNQVPHDWLDACSQLGLTAFRGTELDWLHDPSPERFSRPLRRALRLADAYMTLGSQHVELPSVDGESGMVDVRASRFLRPYAPRLRSLEPLRLRRITTAMTAAARRGGTFHLWWHPHNFGIHREANLEFLTAVLEHFAELRDRHGMVSQTMADVAAHVTRRA